MGISSKLLLDATGTPGPELDSVYCLNDRGKPSTGGSQGNRFELKLTCAGKNAPEHTRAPLRVTGKTGGVLFAPPSCPMNFLYLTHTETFRNASTCREHIARSYKQNHPNSDTRVANRRASGVTSL